ncbi:MAG: hypothetical protein ACLFRK_03210, partial [Candidatus Nanohaloarchaea archaeon]
MSRDEQLYVRLESQNELQDRLGDVQSTIANINKALEVLEQVRSVRENAINKLYENIAHLDDSLASIESGLPGVENTEPVNSIEPSQSMEIDGSVQELHSELETLQNEL